MRTDVVTRAELLRFMRQYTLGLQSSVSSLGAPQAAVVGIAVSSRFEIVFDTVEESRKIANLRSEPRIAFVIGGLVDGDERTVQYEGVADEPAGSELSRIKRVYFAVHPNGRERQSWPGITYIRARPAWTRYSDFNVDPPVIVEFDFAKIASNSS